MKKTMSSSTWREHFKQKLEGWQPPPTGSALESALIEGRLTEDEYIDWAQKTHFWPVLQGGFFTAHEPDPALMSQREVSWSRLVLPVAEWDGVVMLAGLEAPSPLPPNCCFFLARLEDLAPWWERLSSQDSSVAAAPAQEEQPEGLSLEPTAGAPAPLSFAKVSLQRGDESVPPASEGVSTSVRTETNAQGQSVEVTSISFAATETLTLTGIQAPPAPAAPATNEPAKPTKLAAATPGPDRHLLMSIAKRPGYQDQTLNLLTQMGSFFTKSMILGFSETSDYFVPALWTNQFEAPATVAQIPVKDPSIFSIVSGTEKPYHGLVVPNPINDAFFAQWNGGETPAHVTLVPIFFQNRMVGAILGFAAEAQELSTLRSVERFSLEFTKKLGGYVEESAA